MTAAEFLAARPFPALLDRGTLVLLKDIEAILTAVASSSPAARVAVEEVAETYGWCHVCGADREVEVGGVDGNDPRRERVPCPECRGGPRFDCEMTGGRV